VKECGSAHIKDRVKRNVFFVGFLKYFIEIVENTEKGNIKKD